jgi:hypothetical protein
VAEGREAIMAAEATADEEEEVEPEGGEEGGETNE